MRKPFNTYLRLMAAGMIAGLAVVALINVVVDPFRVYGLFDVAALRGYRDKLNGRTAKSERVRREQYDIVVLGSSRVGMGIDPASEVLGPHRVCNMGLGRTNLKEMASVVDFICGERPPEKMVFFLDFHMFNEHRDVTGDFINSPFNTSRSAAEYHMGNLIGAQAFGESKKTIVNSFTGELAECDENGHRTKRTSKTLPRRRFEKTVRNFLTNRELYGGETFAETRLEYLRHIIRTCREHDIELVIAFPPIHAHMLEAIWQAGLWDTFEQCKRLAMGAVSEANTLAGDKWRAELWDFTSYAGYASETVPPAGDATSMTWYMDPSHFFSEIGDFAVSRMLDLPTPDGATEADFGKLLTSQNIAQHLLDIRTERAQYVAANAHEADWIRLAAQDAAVLLGR